MSDTLTAQEIVKRLSEVAAAMTVYPIATGDKRMRHELFMGQMKAYGEQMERLMKALEPTD